MIAPALRMPIGIDTGYDSGLFGLVCQAEPDRCLRLGDEGFEEHAALLAEGLCPACVEELGAAAEPMRPVSSIFTREPWLVCPRGRWWRLVWS